MTGLSGLLSQVQNDALLLPLCVGHVLAARARRSRGRRAGLLLPLVAGATIIDAADRRAGRGGRRAGRALVRRARCARASLRSRAALRVIVIAARASFGAARCAVGGCSTCTSTSWLWPIAREGGGAPATAQLRPRAARARAAAHRRVRRVRQPLAADLAGARRRGRDRRPARRPCSPSPASPPSSSAPCTGDLMRERRRLGFWGGRRARLVPRRLHRAARERGLRRRRSPTSSARYFVGFAAAYAALVGTAVASMAQARARGSCAAARAASRSLLVWQMLDTAYPWAGRMSATEIRDPFEVVDRRGELAVADARRRPRRPARSRPGSAGGCCCWSIALLAARGRCPARARHAELPPRQRGEPRRVIEQLAEHGTPPVLGKDSYMSIRPAPVPPRTVVLHRLDPGDVAVRGSRDLAYPQALGLRPRPTPTTSPSPSHGSCPGTTGSWRCACSGLLLACAADRVPVGRPCARHGRPTRSRPAWPRSCSAR